jgi:hypothetical protein
MTRFIDNQDNTVTDTQTKLTWSKNTLAIDVDHEAAKAKVAELGEGWRLPTVAELFSLVDHAKHGPAIDTEVFADTENDWYWTDTKCTWNDAAVWVVAFSSGSVDGIHRGNGACVRAVRSSQ